MRELIHHECMVSSAPEGKLLCPLCDRMPYEMARVSGYFVQSKAVQLSVRVAELHQIFKAACSSVPSGNLIGLLTRAVAGMDDVSSK